MRTTIDLDPALLRELKQRAHRELADDALPSGILVPDAHLVTLMRENEVRTILTRDRDFRRFPRIEVRDPFS